MQALVVIERYATAHCLFYLGLKTSNCHRRTREESEPRTKISCINNVRRKKLEEESFAFRLVFHLT